MMRAHFCRFGVVSLLVLAVVLNLSALVASASATNANRPNFILVFSEHVYESDIHSIRIQSATRFGSGAVTPTVPTAAQAGRTSPMR